MEEFTADQIIEIHDRIIDKYGGTEGMLNTGTLELLVYKLNRKKDIFRQAALFLHAIAVPSSSVTPMHLKCDQHQCNHRNLPFTFL